MPRGKTIRKQILGLIQKRPFERFLIVLESGDRALVEHPENVAFDPEGKDPDTDPFTVITGRICLQSAFGAVSGLIAADREGAAA